MAQLSNSHKKEVRKMKLFDEWGNAVGDFTPQGGGAEGALVVIALTVTCFLFYAIYWVIKEWLKAFFKALKNHDWGIAFLCSIPICVVALVIIATLAGSVVQAAAARAEVARVAEEKLAMETNPPVDVSIERGMWCEDDIYGNCDNSPHILITVTNRWDGVMATTGATADTGASGEPSKRLTCDPDILWDYLEPGQTEKFACTGEWDYMFGGDTVTTAKKICVYFFPQYSSASPHFLHEPQPIICKDLP